MSYIEKLEMNNICERLSNIMNEQSDLDCENDKPIYFGGIYLLWKNGNVIYGNIFIYESAQAYDDYSADKELWKFHCKDFQENRFSELNKSIENLNDITIEILESNLFSEDESYSFIEELLKEHLENFKDEFGNNMVKQIKDAYNMKGLMEALNNDLLMDELFGEY
jgi:hypothetical protein